MSSPVNSGGRRTRFQARGTPYSSHKSSSTGLRSTPVIEFIHNNKSRHPPPPTVIFILILLCLSLASTDPRQTASTAFRRLMHDVRLLLYVNRNSEHNCCPIDGRESLPCGDSMSPPHPLIGSSSFSSPTSALRSRLKSHLCCPVRQ